MSPSPVTFPVNVAVPVLAEVLFCKVKVLELPVTVLLNPIVPVFAFTVTLPLNATAPAKLILPLADVTFALKLMTPVPVGVTVIFAAVVFVTVPYISMFELHICRSS